jgi:hypothetical protein
MNDWIILATLILIAAIGTVGVFVFFREGPDKNKPEDDDDEILGI